MLGWLRLDRRERNVLRIDLPPWGAERFDAEAPRVQPRGPAIRLKAGLRHQMAYERAGVEDVAPDARQEQGAALAGSENQAVAVGLERRDEL